MNIKTIAAAMSLAAGAATLAACSNDSTVDSEETTAEAEGAASGQVKQGKKSFDNPLPQGNGRACATCHVESEHTTLRPASVSARLASDPDDPLFNRIDADDPGAATPTYQHLQAGLVRVTLHLADNLDVVDPQGNVITNAARTIDVWRAVPTVENTSYTAPYQLDGRAETLEEQASLALIAHSQIPNPPNGIVKHIASYERTVFSSPAAAAIGQAIANGDPPPDVEPTFPPGSDAAAGQAVFQAACAPCHGGATGNLITSAAVHDRMFPVLNADGSADIEFLPDGSRTPAHVRHDVADHHQINIGISLGTYFGQIGALPNFTGVDFPQYRVRFYTDASRTTTIFDLPPLPPVSGPTGFPQAFSVDPGRAAVTGDHADWEAFDVPQLRGISHTAPYFHDNSAPDLQTVLDIYSRFILSGVPEIGMPLISPPEAPGLPPEALTPQMKAQLLAYLNEI